MVQYKTVQVPVESDTPNPTTSSHSQSQSRQTKSTGHPSASHISGDSGVSPPSSAAYEPLPTFPKATGGASAAKLHQIDPDKVTEQGQGRDEYKEDIHNIPYREGQRVEYVPIGGPNSHTSMSSGRIERVLTSKTNAGDKNVAVNASVDQPQYEITNDNTHKKTALKGKNLVNVIDDPDA